MGCDIHLHQEVKINGTWHHYALKTIDRDYKLFAVMAGIRNKWDIKPISEPKGLPPDATFLTIFDHGRDNYHTESWFNAEEIAQVEDWVEAEYEKHGDEPNGWDVVNRYFGYFFQNNWGSISKYPQSQQLRLDEGIEDIRFVFWFDN